MKRCPNCNRTYTDVSLNFCLEDGTPLINEGAPSPDPAATVRYSTPRDTNEPPPTEIYRGSPLNQVGGLAQPPPQHWPPTPQSPMMQPRKKSNAVWWVLGGFAVIAIIGVGLVIMIVAIASLSSDSNSNNANANRGIAKSNSNTISNTNINANSNADGRNSNTTSALPASLADDFSAEKWGTGKYKFGDIWYADDEYHLRSKEKTFLVMYAPSNDYNTENATVKVTARSVDGTASSSGYGLIVHGEKTKTNELEDYALLIYSGTDPQYEIVMHKSGNQSTIVPWTKSGTIRSGTTPNQLEVRVKGTDLSFYINGQYLTHITDTENFKRGLAGFYASDTPEVAFDDLEIQR